MYAAAHKCKRDKCLIDLNNALVCVYARRVSVCVRVYSLCSWWNVNQVERADNTCCLALKLRTLAQLLWNLRERARSQFAMVCVTESERAREGERVWQRERQRE